MTTHFESLSVVREQYNRPIVFGVALLSADLNTPNTYNTARYVFDSITCKTEMEPDSIRGPATTANYTSASSYNFTNANKIVSYADKNSMKVVGHTLWDDPSNTPQFVKDLNLTKSTAHTNIMNSILNNHITYNITHFNNTAPNTVYTWQVTNATLDTNGNVQTDAEAYQVLGAEYFTNTYQYAQTALTNNSITKIKLFYNDNKNISYQLPQLLVLKTAGNLDGVGIKCSTSSSTNLETVLDTIQTNTDILRKNGFEVHYTEVYYMTTSANDIELNKQKQFYSELLKLALRYGVTNFTVWGIKDQDGTPNVPFLFNSSLVPKLCYNEMINVLKTYTPVQDYDIFIVIGQSNSVGFGMSIDSTIAKIGNIMDDDYNNTPNDNIKQLKQDSTTIDAAIEQLDYIWQGSREKYGFTLSFARQYVRERKLGSNRKVLLISSGMGGTGFFNLDYKEGHWRRDSTPTSTKRRLYDATLERLKKGISPGLVGPNSMVKGIFWLQGESDSPNVRTDPTKIPVYKSYLLDTLNNIRIETLKFINNVRLSSKQDVASIPILLGQIAPTGNTVMNTGNTVMNRTIKEVADNPMNINYSFVSAEAIPGTVFNHNLTTGGDQNEGASHYNKTSQIEFGKRYYYVYNNNSINVS